VRGHLLLREKKVNVKRTVFLTYGEKREDSKSITLYCNDIITVYLSYEVSEGAFMGHHGVLVRVMPRSQDSNMIIQEDDKKKP